MNYKFCPECGANLRRTGGGVYWKFDCGTVVFFDNRGTEVDESKQCLRIRLKEAIDELNVWQERAKERTTHCLNMATKLKRIRYAFERFEPPNLYDNKEFGELIDEIALDSKIEMETVPLSAIDCNGEIARLTFNVENHGPLRMGDQYIMMKVGPK